MTNQVDENKKTNGADFSDIKKNKIFGVLAYFIFFIPLLAAKDSRFAMYHGNQGLLLFFLVLIVNIVGTILPFIGWFIIIPIGNLIVIMLGILGIINAITGKMKALPLIGKFDIIKYSEEQ